MSSSPSDDTQRLSNLFNVDHDQFDCDDIKDDALYRQRVISEYMAFEKERTSKLTEEDIRTQNRFIRTLQYKRDAIRVA